MAKKSLYIFLASLLGVMLFLVLHRVAVFFYLYLLAGGYITTGLEYYEFLALDYFSLTITLMLGAWYGIWLGLHWYEKVYEENSHGGLVHHLATEIFPSNRFKNLPVKVAVVERKLEANLRELENLAQAGAAQKSGPVKRKAPRKRAAAKPGA